MSSLLQINHSKVLSNQALHSAQGCLVLGAAHWYLLVPTRDARSQMLPTDACWWPLPGGAHCTVVPSGACYPVVVRMPGAQSVCPVPTAHSDYKTYKILYRDNNYKTYKYLQNKYLITKRTKFLIQNLQNYKIITKHLRVTILVLVRIFQLVFCAYVGKNSLLGTVPSGKPAESEYSKEEENTLLNINQIIIIIINPSWKSILWHCHPGVQSVRWGFWKINKRSGLAIAGLLPSRIFYYCNIK